MEIKFANSVIQNVKNALEVVKNNVRNVTALFNEIWLMASAFATLIITKIILQIPANNVNNLV
jgi:hypothetical protein